MATTFPVFTDKEKVEVTLEVGTHALELIVEDSAGNESLADTVTITVKGLPVIESFAPAQGAPGTPVTIEGRNFINVQKVEFGGVPADPPTIESKTRIKATVPQNAPAGDVPLRVTTQYGTAESPEPFHVEEAMTVTEIDPAVASAGTARTVYIRGTGLANASQVAFSDPGIVATVRNSADTEVEINLSVTDQAVAGQASFTVATPRGTVDSADFDVHLTVTEAMTITDIEPASLSQGEKKSAVIEGTALANASSVEFPEGIGVSIDGSNKTSVFITLTVPETVPPGPKEFTVTAAAGTVHSADFGVYFTVTEAQPEMTITGIVPKSLSQGTKLAPVTITGTGLADASSVSFSPDGIAALIEGSDNETVKVRLNVPATVPVGPKGFSVTTPAGTVNSLDFDIAFVVTESVTPTPTITPKPTATITPKPTATITPKPTATITPKPTATITPKPTATITPKPTATLTPKPTLPPSEPTPPPGGHPLFVSEPRTDRPVTEVSGIGPSYTARLKESGVTTLDQLAAMDAGTLAQVLDVSEVRAMGFIDEAKQLLT